MPAAMLRLVLLKVLLARLPSVVMAEMHTTTMRASMTAYSTAVGPSSSRKNSDRRCDNCGHGLPFHFTPHDTTDRVYREPGKPLRHLGRKGEVAAAYPGVATVAAYSAAGNSHPFGSLATPRGAQGFASSPRGEFAFIEDAEAVPW